MENSFDLIIIGSGPAGLSASIYASRYKVANLVIGSPFDSLAAKAHKICNYPSESEITGPDLVKKMYDNAKNAGGIMLMDQVVGIEGSSGDFKITTQSNGEYQAKAVIICTGTKHRKLNLKNEEKYIGKGLSYCATCDAMFFKDKVVVVIGGSDSANTTSLYLSKIAKKVYQLYRGESLRGEQAWVDQIKSLDNIEVIYNTNVVDLMGEPTLQKIKLDKEHNGSDELEVNGLFVAIGSVPDKALFERLGIETNEGGYVKVGRDQKTNLDGIWAAGDLTDGSNGFRQIITACSEGSVAAEDVYKYLQKNK